MILGVDVPPDLVELWCGWLAPDPQPFIVGTDARWQELEGDSGVITPELRDTFRLWAVAPGSQLLWLSDERFHGLPKPVRASLVREQVTRRSGNPPGVGGVPSVRGWRDLLDPTALRREADGHRFVWWPGLVATDPIGILDRLLSADRLPSRHAEVSNSVWRRCEDILPNAQAVAGTWPQGSSSCCFSTVMTAAGSDDSGACDSVEPFGEWLDSACRKGGNLSDAGTVLVWRDRDGLPVHAAVAIGEGWGLEKPSQEWHSPHAVATISDIIRTTRLPGQRLEKHTILP